MFGSKKNDPEVEGIFPQAFVRQVCCSDPVAEKTGNIIANINQSNKSSWLEAKEYKTRLGVKGVSIIKFFLFSHGNVIQREELNVKLEELIDLRRARVRNLSKLSDLQLEENCEMICKQINNFPALRGERILVDTNLDNLMNTEMAFTELCHLHGDRNGAESKQTRKYSNKTYFTFSLIEAKQVETMKFGKVNYMIGLFHPISGFVTDLFSYEDMDNEVLAEQNGKG